MSIQLKVMTLDGKELMEPYLLRVARWTEEQYFKEAPESQIVEFADGELIVHSPVNIRHQQLIGFLTVLLRSYIRSKNLGEVLNGPTVVQLRPGLDYEPDIFFVAREQLDHFSEQYFSGAPALIIEVLSPGTRNYDLVTKATHYREYGVPEYWVVDPESQILYRHMLSETPSAPYLVTQHGGGRLESHVIAGFWVEMGWLWQEPLPGELGCLEQILHGG